MCSSSSSSGEGFREHLCQLFRITRESPIYRLNLPCSRMISEGGSLAGGEEGEGGVGGSRDMHEMLLGIMLELNVV